MYNYAPHAYECPFCRIAAGLPTEIEGQADDIILRTESATAFISAKWWRSNKGNVIIIPNKHVENLYDMPETLGHNIFDMSKRVALALRESYECEGVSTRQHNEPAGGQSVWHYHLHVFPRYKGDDLYANHKDTYMPSAEERRPYAEKLKRYLSKNR